MKCTLLLTQECNLRCDYCYITKRNLSMTLSTAKKTIDYIFDHTPTSEILQLGFFGGEPLLEFDLMQKMTAMIQEHGKYDAYDVQLGLVTNGTVFNQEIADFINKHSIGFGVSCDGMPEIQDRYRKFTDGTYSSHLVESNLREACASLTGNVMVNSVYTPDTFRALPETVEYLYSIGIRKIYLNADYSAAWTIQDAMELSNIYDDIGEKYLAYYEKDDPAMISLIDNKIACIINKGYKPEDRCQMGRLEFAFTPDGYIFPCERLVGDGSPNTHCIGNIYDGVDYSRLTCSPKMKESSNTECDTCSLKNYCMNWCGCTNHHATGYYNQVSAFMCHSERSAVQTGFNILQKMEERYGAKTLLKLVKTKA